MHDIRAIREDPYRFDASLDRRGLPPVSEALLALDEARRGGLSRQQELQARRNQLAKEIPMGKDIGLDIDFLLEEAQQIRAEIAALETGIAAGAVELNARLAAIPNRVDDSVPDGLDESRNVVLRETGDPAQFDFTPREHFELGEALGMMLFEPAARMSGSRFTILQGPLARLERALGQFMLEIHTTRHGYTETQVPLLVNDAAAYGTDKLPKFAEDLFRTTDGRWLIPTAEVPLTAMVMDQIVPESSLPMRMTALSECFRSEAGSAGRDTRGMLRQHQFRKVELVVICHPDQSNNEHEDMTQAAEAVLEALGLAWRRVVLCAGDTGFGAAKTYDLEVWLPGQGAWREISSCSTVRDFQARRMNARMRGADGKVSGLVHTLNGSGVALGRALIAVMETYQQADGSIRVPEVLRPWMGGVEVISRG